MTPVFPIRSEDGLNKQIQDTSCNFCIYNFAIRVIFYRENFCEKFSFWEFIFADRGTKNKIAKKRPRKIFLPHVTLKWKSFQPQKKYVHIASLCDVAVTMARASRLGASHVSCNSNEHLHAPRFGEFSAIRRSAERCCKQNELNYIGKRTIL